MYALFILLIIDYYLLNTYVVKSNWIVNTSH